MYSSRWASFARFVIAFSISLRVVHEPVKHFWDLISHSKRVVPSVHGNVVLSQLCRGFCCQIASLPLQVDAEGNPRSVSDLQTKVAVLQLCGESVASAGEVKAFVRHHMQHSLHS